MAKNVLVFGGSRHIGYHAATRFLDSGATVTFLLRNPAALDDDSIVQKYVSTNRARLVKGDALIISDVQKAWDVATASQEVDLILCTIGFSGTPSFSILKGVQINPPNLLTASLLNLLSTMPSYPENRSPKIILVSATGLHHKSRAGAPLLLRPLYSYFIQSPLADKLGAERILYHLSGRSWDPEVPEPGRDILDPGWKDIKGLPKAGMLKHSVIIRPSVLTDGECLGDREQGDCAPYRVGEGEVGGWTVSRRDVAHFIFNLVTIPSQWDKFKDKQISIAY
ncbi:hypothetical protein P691DRAFT_675337 [Macrolepiota fuliginosa MF-IS2]|uniref:NAD(P)-binding domain-containing protein n=1 Tax=Macrolepiota fuliginosa MF-IS2 TaxID=1400762 RepID=A0A9P5X6S1_9AGAR|nr:hypothetical protein P691DRAFT_675337 [Macrolepiota fuliginosa MF-IS2]